MTFEYEPSFLEERDEALHQIEKSLKSSIKSIYNPTLFNFHLWGTPSCHVVRGRPWREDLNRWPATRLQVGFQGGKGIEEERLWELLRPYGRIHDISMEKEGALVTFSRMRGATSARNCAHGLKMDDGTRLVLNYKSESFGDSQRNLISYPRLERKDLIVLISLSSFLARLSPIPSILGLDLQSSASSLPSDPLFNGWNHLRNLRSN